MLTIITSSEFLAESTVDFTIQEFLLDLQMIWPFAYTFAWAELARHTSCLNWLKRNKDRYYCYKYLPIWIIDIEHDIDIFFKKKRGRKEMHTEQNDISSLGVFLFCAPKFQLKFLFSAYFIKAQTSFTFSQTPI